MKLKKGNYKLACFEYGKKGKGYYKEDANGYLYGSFGIKKDKNNFHWVITHLITGYRVWRFRTLTRCTKFIDRINSFHLWKKGSMGKPMDISKYYGKKIKAEIERMG